MARDKLKAEGMEEPGFQEMEELKFRMIAAAGTKDQTVLYGLTDDGRVFMLGDREWLPLVMMTRKRDSAKA